MRHDLYEECESLKTERDALAARVQEMEKALENVRDTSSSTRLMNLAHRTLATPDTSAQILARRDAAVLLNAVEHLKAIGKNGAKWYYAELIDMADELLKGSEKEHAHT